MEIPHLELGDLRSPGAHLKANRKDGAIAQSLEGIRGWGIEELPHLVHRERLGLPAPDPELRRFHLPDRVRICLAFFHQVLKEAR